MTVEEIAQEILDRQAWDFTIDLGDIATANLRATVTDMSKIRLWLDDNYEFTVLCEHPEFYGWTVDELVDHFDADQLTDMLKMALR